MSIKICESLDLQQSDAILCEVIGSLLLVILMCSKILGQILPARDERERVISKVTINVAINIM
jgi:hypothetical protein